MELLKWENNNLISLNKTPVKLPIWRSNWPTFKEILDRVSYPLSPNGFFISIYLGELKNKRKGNKKIKEMLLDIVDNIILIPETQLKSDVSTIIQIPYIKSEDYFKQVFDDLNNLEIWCDADMKLLWYIMNYENIKDSK